MISGRSSVVEREAASFDVPGSSPGVRSIFNAACSSPVERLVEAQRRKEFNSPPWHQGKE